MLDRVERVRHSTVQHGPSSDRVYALELDPTDMPGILDELQDLAEENGYGKLVAKARESDFSAFMARGYKVEARIPEFFGQDEPGLFLGKYLDAERATEEQPEKVAEVLMTAQLERTLNGLKGEPEPVTPGSGRALEIREASPDDAEAVAECYDSVFVSYPFPIHEPDHIREAQEEGTRFFTVRDGADLVAASSMEPGGAPGTVEMTDFATLPSHRGQGLATRLLDTMDRQATESGLRVAYTIARALSHGMNITFARCSYQYAGTLINNTQIAGSIESMNIWYKTL